MYIVYIQYTLLWMRMKVTTLTVIDTGCIGRYRSKYHTIMTMMVPKEIFNASQNTVVSD